MSTELDEIVSIWLRKAKSDIDTARVLIHGSEPHLDTGTYHCQQAAEKALKAWLTSRSVEFRKTRDLSELTSQCMERHVEFGNLLESARFLAPFAGEFRYPGDLF